MVFRSTKMRYDLTAQEIFQPVVELSRGFLTRDLRNRMRTTFYRLVEPCFREDSRSDRWVSELCTDGTPIEFGVTVYDNYESALRFVVDTQCRPGTALEASAAIERDAPAIVPCETIVETVSQVAQRHLEGVEEAVRTYVWHSVRFTSSPEVTGRIYLNTMWRSRQEIDGILYGNLRQHTPECLNSPLLGNEQIAGVAYDFGQSGVSRFKLYVRIDRDVREKVLAMAEGILGERASLVDSLLGGVTRLKDPGWKTPPTLASIGLSIDGRHRELKLALPVILWEWDSYDELRPVMSCVLNRWGRDRSQPRSETGGAIGMPSPRFALTHLCLAISTTDESFTVYFRPLKSLEDAHAVPTGKGSTYPSDSWWRHDTLDTFFSNYCV